MHTAPWDAIRCIAKALGEFEALVEDSWQYDVYCWKQTWANTACGFGGVAGQAITSAYTVVLRHGNAGYVYHNARFAGEVDFRKEKVRECLDNKQFPGAADWKTLD